MSPLQASGPKGATEPDQLWRFAGFVLSTGGLALAVVLLGPRLLGSAGPEAEIVTALKRVEQRGASVRLPFGTLRSTRLQYERLSVTLGDSREEAWVSGTLDFVGFLERPASPFPTSVSSLGLERMPWRLEGGTWRPQRGELPRLSAIVEALEHRRLVLEASAAPGVTHRVYRVEGWYIRSEREDATVSEDYRLQEDRPQKPVDERGTSRFGLSPTPDGGFAW
jgi:hypothetical protein